MGDIMKKNLIINYAKNMGYDDMNQFITDNNIDISEADKNVIYSHIKSYYNVFFDDPIKYIKMLKEKIDDNTYYNILMLYDKYKDIL